MIFSYHAVPTEEVFFIGRPLYPPHFILVEGMR